MEAHVGKYSKIINIRLSSVVDPDSIESESGSRLLMTKIWNLLIHRPLQRTSNYRRSLQPSKENI